MQTYVFFVIQMKDVRFFTPNRDTHPEFAKALLRASEKGVKVLAYDCQVSEDEVHIKDPVPVVLEDPLLYEMAEPLTGGTGKIKESFPGAVPDATGCGCRRSCCSRPELRR